MKLPKIPLAQTIIQLCIAKKMKHIVISPGSRNAPLTIGFSNHEYFSCYSIVDERCAAFFALGIAQQLQEPVALVCTSGSAMLNYYPAIAEAYYSSIPLVVISADRPNHLVGIGDGQTINQKGVYQNHILYEANLKEDIIIDNNSSIDEPTIIKNLENKVDRFLGLQKDLAEFNVDEINSAINSAIINRGPVHINAPFNEPLYDMVDEFSVTVKPAQPNFVSHKEDLSSYAQSWNKASKKMVLVGVNAPNAIDKKILEFLANDDSVIVFTETTSNLYHDEFFPSIDKIIAPLENADFEKLQPEILLTFGGLIVSKKVKAFLRKHQPKQHWHIDETKANDTFFSLSNHFKYSVNQFFNQFLSDVRHMESVYKPYWSKVKAYRKVEHEKYLENCEHSDLKVFEKVLQSLPNNAIVHSGNSSAIRYMQLFNTNKNLQVYCNRGTSGIDGSTSTAIGAAVASKEQTILITGDLSFFYDSNALWNNYIPNNFRIILINNGGGGIFRILPGHKNTDNFDTYFETKHNLTAKQLCAMYNIAYQEANSMMNLKNELQNFYDVDRTPKLLEIFTPRENNDQILLNYFKALV
ncbi:2-succinyl-5-enolpyruvyl-6-hydroxy-3-cyclohexene-1-carboxylic-acid synthase [Flavobacteriaceae bacterium S0825]|uniref:2-succinyl-5-enolpyruvyl-6-hydroxy-3- cyclohexene-1-carboxylic-acid synthase n=1 Tax=Gaetbulibacter sp. S0825 TaxID=2720084 RepID=UPI0014317647|nr:2-succinyl-5-enolpyruvyl-6-hydroxy-3-cyclohexene-1-carboxylic-acid synthase [Gaetbulibacter sp. S0825]MCK0109582.1 2-succinyl-5-enolpyruvyl-6-hydroxy-3-cyclohexene-1-carboxylic-acid synthase [Flavobacteriaceae bacterium S0825]NIX65215.1 2-succinyl-5-enolpyruvyl-6-hydroxy-3-cyclohexene-1-carboxylic-acid synthase [Gaetbulibacter sp. S0825]